MRSTRRIPSFHGFLAAVPAAVVAAFQSILRPAPHDRPPGRVEAGARLLAAGTGHW